MLPFNYWILLPSPWKYDFVRVIHVHLCFWNYSRFINCNHPFKMYILLLCGYATPRTKIGTALPLSSLIKASHWPLLLLSTSNLVPSSHPPCTTIITYSSVCVCEIIMLIMCLHLMGLIIVFRVKLMTLVLHRDVSEEVRHGLVVVYSSYCLR